MPSITRLFLRKLRENWRGKFPFLRPVDLDESSRRVSGGNFVCDQYFAERQLAYFCSVEIHHQRKGEVTIDVTVSDSKQRSVREAKCGAVINPQESGTYRLGMFVNGRDFWWALADTDARLSNDLKSLGIEPSTLDPASLQNRWKPKTYDLPMDTIIDEAIADINQKLELYVFPKLKIAC